MVTQRSEGLQRGVNLDQRRSFWLGILSFAKVALGAA